MENGRIERNEQHLELLSQAWYLSAAPERAVEPLAEAAALSDSGELFLRLARLHIDAERWSEAEEAAESALEKGGLRQEGQAWLLRGMAEVRLEKFAEARRRFERAARFEETARYASQWIAYLEAEEARLGAGNS
jgi:tetratricopeptide (TPR) repeat protein